MAEPTANFRWPNPEIRIYLFNPKCVNYIFSSANRFPATATKDQRLAAYCH